MSIDWFTVAAQVVNLIILLWLMKLFLYKPILKAIDAREARIRAELAGAQTDKTAAEEQRDTCDRKNAELAEQSAAMLRTARDEAETEKQRLLAAAHDAADDLSRKRRETVAAAVTSLAHELRERLQDAAFGLARTVLTDLAEVELEQQAVRVFARRLKNLDPSQKADWLSALKHRPEPIVLCTAFDLSAQLRAGTETAIRETFGADSQVRFEVSPRVIMGIELSAQGQKVAWSVDDQLSTMAESYEGFLKESDQ